MIGLIMLGVNLTKENGGVPYKNSLTELSGYVEWIKNEKYGVKFKFINNDTHLDYMSKFGGKNKVYERIIDSKGLTISVLYKETIPREGFKGTVYHDIWQISIGDEILKSYEELDEAYRGDNFLLFIIIPLFLFGGVYIGRKAWIQNH